MSPFKQRVIQIVGMIPKGKVVSYGQVALMAGVPRGARQVGWVMFSVEEENLPWWRVINNEGRISIKNPGVSPIEQKEELEKDGVVVCKEYGIDIEKYRWRPEQKILNKLQLDDEYIFKILEKF